jgi:hypothetical protein
VQVRWEGLLIFDRLRVKIRCLRGKHIVARNRVRRDGVYLTGKCIECGNPVRKLKEGKWERYVP